MKFAKLTLMFSLSVWLLAAAVSLFTDRAGDRRAAHAGYVDPSATGIVAFNPKMQQGSYGEEGWVLVDDGSVWYYDYARHVTDGVDPIRPDDRQIPPPPVSLSQIKFWTSACIVTTDNTIWTWASDPYNTGDVDWRNLGTPPGLPVGAPDASVGGLKGKFGG